VASVMTDMRRWSIARWVGSLCVLDAILGLLLSVAAQQVFGAPQWVSWCGNTLPSTREFLTVTVHRYPRWTPQIRPPVDGSNPATTPG